MRRWLLTSRGALANRRTRQECLTMKTAAIYARVSGDRQRQEQTIASQTAALIEFAGTSDYSVPAEWVIEDDGFSGAELIRPGLERIRDLAAEGAIEAVLVHSPDRLCREYVHQMLLIEEFSRAGVEVLFVQAPRAQTPEDRLLLQFQGMFAEYERAQILERSRRGKLHRARQGQINVLSGAPYGFLYVRKSEAEPARYEVLDAEATVVRAVYAWYTVDGLSIGAITARLNQRGVPTRKQGSRWERSTVWAMLRNPAYKGRACFGKTHLAPRQRITRPLRLRGGFASRNSAQHEVPRERWIEIPVPALVTEESFALAEERLERNKRTSPRRTVEPTLLQGMVSCRKCGYALYRTSTRSSARKINYYRCLGSDHYRHLPGPACDNRPIRQDLLDDLVWAEVLSLLEDPALIRQEIDRRLDAARANSPTRRREAELDRELIRVRKSMERLLTAYQEDLLSLDDLRRRMPGLRQREQSLRGELQALRDRTAEETAMLRLSETLASFLKRLRETAESLDIAGRQKILRLLVKEVLVDKDSITIRHSIPIPRDPDDVGEAEDATLDRSSPASPGYLLRSGSGHAALGSSPGAFHQVSIGQLERRGQPPPDVEPHPLALGVLLDRLAQQSMVDVVERALFLMPLSRTGKACSRTRLW
jgi:site-specific DNA recombinase